MVAVRMYRKQMPPYKKVLERFGLVYKYFVGMKNFRAITSRENFMFDRFILIMKDILSIAVAWEVKDCFAVFYR